MSDLGSKKGCDLRGDYIRVGRLCVYGLGIMSRRGRKQLSDWLRRIADGIEFEDYGPNPCHRVIFNFFQPVAKTKQNKEKAK